MDHSHGAFVEFEHRAFRDFDHHGVLLHIVDDAVNAGGGHHLVAGLQSGDAGCHGFLLLLLWADQEEIEHHHHDAHHHERAAKNALGAFSRCGLREDGTDKNRDGCHWESDRV